MDESSCQGPATHPLPIDRRLCLVTDSGLKIVSGGQTGVDQGSLAAALDYGAPCGGWCPERRQSEDGAIPATYPVDELPGEGYAGRTLRNVQDSEGTAILFCGTLEGGTQLTETYCIAESRPYILIDASTITRTDAVEALVCFIGANNIRTLNVAGPRASKWPDAHVYARTLLAAVLTQLNSR